ncbi:MAG: FtsX-like permease family protein [Lachnospiraceae bacterium]|nr:FtsX-like permease family protein [Lachnospiraceae bacterium]
MNNKKIVFQVTKTYMKKNRKRTTISFLGILVTVILMTAVFIGKDTVMKYMENAVAADQGSWHMQVYDVDKTIVDKIKALPWIDKAEVSRALGYSEFAASGDPALTPYIELKGYSGEIFNWMNIRLVEGRYPQNDRELIISRRALDEGSAVRVGDTIEVDAFTRYIHAYLSDEEKRLIEEEGKEPGGVIFGPGFMVTHGDTVKAPDHFPCYEENDVFEEIHKPAGLKGTYTVVGIMESPDYESAGQGGYIALTATGSDVADNEKVNLVLTIDLATRLDVHGEIAKLIDASRTDEERAEIEKSGISYVGKDGIRIPLENGKILSNDMLLSFAAKGQDESFNFLMVFFQAFFIILITAASLVLIYNVFSMSFKERSRYLGMLSSVGATGSQKRWSVYYEVFSLLLIALPLGIIMGLFVIKGGMELLKPHFSKIISAIASNVISGRSSEIEYRLMINPVNLVFIILFSALTVWLSALIPAMKISKTGPVESIRGNDGSDKIKKKGYKTYLRFMMKGKAEMLLAHASVERNTHSTKGIIRSITAFIALTLITAFAAGSFTDILESKANREQIVPGKAYSAYPYHFSIEDETQYQRGKEDIASSAEVSGYREMRLNMYTYHIDYDIYTDEYKNALSTTLEKYFPAGMPEWVRSSHMGNGDLFSEPAVNIITLAQEDYDSIAKKAGIDVSGYRDEINALIYEDITISTDDFRFGSDGAVKPDYSVYQIKRPLKAKAGDITELLTNEYDEENDDLIDVTVPVKVAGYVSAEDIKEFYTLRGSELWLLVSESTKAQIDEMTGIAAHGIDTKSILFDVNTDDSKLIRRLSQIKDEYGESAVEAAGMLGKYTDFKTAVTKIADIVAVCFTILIAIICLMNLYNSVMGRRLARQKELSVLHSMGMGRAQRSKMLMLENIRLLTASVTIAALITAAFVTGLRILLDMRFGHMVFSLPIWAMLITLGISIAGLMIFTAVSYREDDDKQIIEEIRMESV